MGRIRLRALITLTLFWVSAESVACVATVYPSHLPEEEVDGYPEIHLAKVESLKFEKGRSKPFGFEAKLKIESAIKGSLQRGQVINAHSDLEISDTRCPLELVQGQSYLVFLYVEKGTYLIPRFKSFTTAITHEKFLDYAQEARRDVIRLKLPPTFCSSRFGRRAHWWLLPEAANRSGVADGIFGSFSTHKPGTPFPEKFYCVTDEPVSKEMSCRAKMKRSVVGGSSKCISETFDVRELCPDELKEFWSEAAAKICKKI